MSISQPINLCRIRIKVGLEGKEVRNAEMWVTGLGFRNRGKLRSVRAFDFKFETMSRFTSTTDTSILKDAMHAYHFLIHTLHYLPSQVILYG